MSRTKPYRDGSLCYSSSNPGRDNRAIRRRAREAGKRICKFGRRLAKARSFGRQAL